MKKMFLFLILTLGWLVSEGQTGRPCATYDQTRDISGMKEILMGNGIYASNLRIAYALCINRGIGKVIVNGSKSDIEYVIENTILLDVDFVIPSDYLNGARVGDNVEFTTLTGQPSDKWAAFRYMGVDYIYAKVSCMNPQKPKKPGVFIIEEVDKNEQKPLVYRDYTNQININLYTPPIKEQEERVKVGPFVFLFGAFIAGTITTVLVLKNKQQNHNHYYDSGGRVTPVEPENPSDSDRPGGASGQD